MAVRNIACEEVGCCPQLPGSRRDAGNKSLEKTLSPSTLQPQSQILPITFSWYVFTLICRPAGANLKFKHWYRAFESYISLLCLSSSVLQHPQYYVISSSWSKEEEGQGGKIIKKCQLQVLVVKRFQTEPEPTSVTQAPLSNRCLKILPR